MAVVTRRTVVHALGVSLLAGGLEQSEVVEMRRYADPATEFDVLRLTDPAHSSRIAAPPRRAFDRRGRIMVFASDAGGSWQPWLMELRTGRMRQLARVEGLDCGSLTFSADDREVIFSHSGGLGAIALTNQKTRQLHAITGQPAGAVVPDLAAGRLYFVEAQGAQGRLMRVDWPSGRSPAVVAVGAGITDPLPHPKRPLVAWRAQDGLWLDGQRLTTPAGRVLQAYWSPDGESLLYLLEPAARGELNSIREQNIGSHVDTLIARTSQFVSFAPNANASAFAGASRSLASPGILLLLRVTRRELIICEHKASNATRTGVMFTPDSQRVLFESDRHGRPALYMMNVERLIEKTGD